MPETKAPVLFQPKARLQMITALLGIALTVGGILMIGDDSGSLLGYGLGPRVRASTAGWFVLGLGILIDAVAVVVLVRACPTLEVGPDGIIYTRCLQGVTRINWSEFGRVEISRRTVPSPSGSDIELEDVNIFMKNGQRVSLAAFVPAEDLHAAIKDGADRFAG